MLFASFMGCSLKTVDVEGIADETASDTAVTRLLSNNYKWSQRNSHTVAYNRHWAIDTNGDGTDELVYIKNGTREYWAMKNDSTSYLWAYRNTAFNPGINGSHWNVMTGNNTKGLLYTVDGSKDYRVITRAGDFYWGARTSSKIGFSGKHWVVDVDSDGISDVVFSAPGSIDYKVVNGATGRETLWTQRISGNIVGLGGNHFPILYKDKNGITHNALAYNKSGSYYYYVLYKYNNRYYDDLWATRTSRSNLGLSGRHWAVDTNNDGYNDSLIYNRQGSASYNKLTPTSDEFWQTRTYQPGYGGEHFVISSNGVDELIYNKTASLEYWSMPN